MGNIYTLTGLDINDPTPGTKRELKTNRGRSSGSARVRDTVILCNKLSSVGSASVDGRGDPLEFPVVITEGRAEVIERFGEGSEALLLYDAYVTTDPEGAVALCCVPPGTGSGSVQFTFATASTAASAVKISCMGEDAYAAIAVGDTADAIKSAVITEVNKQQKWPFTASSGGVGIVTLTSKTAGTRHDHFLDRVRMAFTKPCATTVSKGAVTPGSTDDDQTNAILNLDSYEIYYQVNPKAITSAPTATDNGIGEHLAMVNASRLPSSGRDQVLIVGVGGTATQAITVAGNSGNGMNSEWAFCVHAENNDWSPGMIAAHFAGVLARQERSDPACNLVDYGIREPSSQPFAVPDPYTKTDRPTTTEIKTMLNSGVTPIGFTPTGKPYIVRHVTTRSETSSIKDYRARPGHIPSVITDTSQRIVSAWNAVKQPKIANDPVDGQKPLPGFSYPRDVRGVCATVIDEQVSRGILDPDQLQTMKDSIDVGRLADGVSWRVQIEAVKHLNRSWILFEEVSPPG